MEIDQTVEFGVEPMTGSHLRVTLNAMGNLLMEGDVRGLASYFECPLPVYFQDKFMLIHCREKIAEALSGFIVHAACRDVRRIEPELVRVEDSTPQRSLFVVRWNYLLDTGVCVASNLVRYVGRRGELDGLLCIELVEYLETGRANFPDHLLGVIEARRL